MQKRNLGGSHSAPILICIIPLQSDINVQTIMSVITSIDETANIATSPCGITHIGYAAKLHVIIRRQIENLAFILIA